MSDDIGLSVRNRLEKTSQVTDICGRQIFADALEQGIQPPAVVVQAPAALAHEDLNSSNRIFQSTITVLAYGKDRTEANSLAKAIRNYALPADLRGRVEGMDWQEVSMVAGPNELMDQPVDGSDQYRKLTFQQFIIWNNPV